jgi:hypothetical protein
MATHGPTGTDAPRHAHRAAWIVGSYCSRIQIRPPVPEPGTRIAYRDGLLPHGFDILSVAEGWQRNYWDRIIRGDGAYERIAKYIQDNPMNSEGDRFGNNAGRSPKAG